MPIEGKLKDISLTSQSINSHGLGEVAEVKKLNEKEKKELEEKLLSSKMGKKLEEMLASIQKENSEETRRDRLVVLLDDFFEVGDDKDEQVQRLVVDGKTYVRFAMGDESFDVELSDVLMPSLVDWYIELATSRVNDGVEEDKKIALKYEKEQEFIIKTQEELATLQTQVTGGTVADAGSGVGLRDRVKTKREGFKKGIGSFDDLKSSTRDRVSSKFTMATSIIGSFTGVSALMAVKDPTKAAESKKKWYDFSAKIDGFKTTLASAFGVGGTTPSATPSTPSATPPQGTLT